MCRRLGTLCPTCMRGVSTSVHHLCRWNRQSVPKRRYIKFRRRNFTQKKEYKIKIINKQGGFLKKSFYTVSFPMNRFVLSQLLHIKPGIPKFPVIWKPSKSSGRQKDDTGHLPYRGPQITTVYPTKFRDPENLTPVMCAPLHHVCVGRVA